MLEAVISKQGTIENLKVLTGHPMLALAASEAVRQWRFAAARRQGSPVDVIVEVAVEFKIR